MLHILVSWQDVEGHLCMSSALGMTGDAQLIELLTKWSPSSLADVSDMYVKMLHLDPDEVPRQQQALCELRRSLDAAGRQAKALEYKAHANGQFGKQAWRVALVGYLAGVWFLRNDKDDPPCPRLLANHLSELHEAAAALGTPAAPSEAQETYDANPVGAEPPAAVVVVTLRSSLLVNLAAAALKLTEFRLARSACEAVLASEPRHSKALWRLAKAHEGDSNLSGAIAAASRLARLEPSNAEAARLLEVLQRRRAKKGKMFGSIVERAHAEGDTLYTRREHERDVDDAMHKGFTRCMLRDERLDESIARVVQEEREEAAQLADEYDAISACKAGELGELGKDAAEVEKPQTLGEHMEEQARVIHKARLPYDEDEGRCMRVMGKAYRHVKTQRAESVRQSLPPNVLASYVDP